MALALRRDAAGGAAGAAGGQSFIAAAYGLPRPLQFPI